MLLNVALAENDHPTTLRQLRRLEDEFEADYGDLSQDARFERFVASPEHEEWLKRRSNPGKD